MTGTVLVVGASGLVGTAAVERFVADGWSVVSVSRREPELELHGHGRHLHVPLDLRDRDACDAFAAQHTDITHAVYAAVSEAPGLVPGWTDPAQMDVNLEMFRNVIDPLLARAREFQHLSILQGTKAYGAHLHPIRIPARERHPRDDHANFYWLHEDYVRERAASADWSFSIWRPQLIVGPNHGVVMNLPPVLGAYAAICREIGRPFAFPGGAEWVWEAVDTRLVASALVWGATAPQAAGETFNLTNGEPFSWRDLWPSIADALGVESGPDEPTSMSTFFDDHLDTWERIVERHGLRRIPLPALLGESHHYADVCFAYGAEEPPPATFVSTVKVKQAGFTDTFDTETSVLHWLGVLMDRSIIPSTG